MKTIKRILILILVLFLKLLFASAIAALIATAFSTQMVISELSGIGGNVKFSDRISMTGYDAFYFGKLYWGFITIAFLFAFLSAWLFSLVVKFGRPIIFTVAGMVAMLVMLLAMERVFFGVPIVAGARDNFGLFLQILAGGIGGFLFARLTTPKAIKKKRSEGTPLNS